MKKEEEKEPKQKEVAVKKVQDPKCDSSVPTDPHYGQAGEYDSNCRWIPDNGK